MVSRAAAVGVRPLPAVTPFCPKLTPVPWPALELDPLLVLRWSFYFLVAILVWILRPSESGKLT